MCSSCAARGKRRRTLPRSITVCLLGWGPGACLAPGSKDLGLDSRQARPGQESAASVWAAGSGTGTLAAGATLRARWIHSRADKYHLKVSLRAEARL